MNCLICLQAELLDGFTSVIFERGEMKIVVNHVPARICPNCGESYVEETVAARLLLGAEEMYTAGELNAVREYELLSQN